MSVLVKKFATLLLRLFAVALLLTPSFRPVILR